MFSDFHYVKPKTLAEALGYLGQHGPDSKILAGGTDLFILMRRNLAKPACVVDIKGIPETKRFEYSPQEGQFIGATVTVNEIAEAESIRKKYAALAQAANSLASYQLRNRATLVGNICNASPGADLAGPLLIYEADVHIASTEGIRMIPLREFFTGVKKTVLKPTEMVIGVSLPPVPTGDISSYLKQGRIKGHDLAIAGLAARLSADKKFYLAMAAVAPTPIRLFAVENTLNSLPLTPELAGIARDEVRKHISPIADVRSSAEYRLHISGVLAKRAVERLLAMGGF